MAAKHLPSQDVLNQLLRYDPETGNLFWKKRPIEYFNGTPSRSALHICNCWNTRYGGTPALNNLHIEGYLTGHLLGTGCKAHRVIWKLVYGEEADQVDHIDGNRSNNQIKNLRSVPGFVNAQNTKKRSDNTSGSVGVMFYPYRPTGPVWMAKIKNKTLGYFKTFDEALAVRRAAEIQYNFHPNHGRE